MKKYLTFISIILGIFVNLAFFSSDFNSLLVSAMPVFETLIPIFIIEAIGVILGILALTKYKKDNNKILTIIGLVLNIIPIVSYLPTLLLIL
ncbi:MAG: hypothetical protein IJ086_07190 [Clostridium sp.]|nr:hypothetical protein [Clostridium sp.]